MNRRLAASLAALTVTIGVSAAAQAPAANGLPLPEFMGHVMQRNAEQLWAWTSVEIDAAGEHTGLPQSDEQWEQAESDALTLSQLTYALQGSTIQISDPRWSKLLGDLREAAEASAKAAEGKDPVALTKAAEEINARCVACHYAFAPQLEVPPPPVPLPRT